MSHAEATGLLVLWYRHESTAGLAALGYPHECPSTRGWKASRQWDNLNGAFESDERHELAQRIGHILDSIPEPHRTALHILARNRATGVSVWRSPRLPDDEAKRQALVAEALEMFGAKL